VLCEAALAPELAALQAGEEEEEEAELAAALLALADEQGLQQLRDVALAHCVQHLPQVCAGRAWRQLSAGQVTHGAREVVGRWGRRRWAWARPTRGWRAPAHSCRCTSS
jgi:hypothetical protein